MSLGLCLVCFLLAAKVVGLSGSLHDSRCSNYITWLA